MILNTTNNITYYNISNDWGWYIDTENNSYINTNINIYRKKVLDNLASIEEEYNYHQLNYKDVESLDDIFNDKKLKKKFEQKDFIYNICSTTLITALLTYAIFFLI